MFVESGLSNKRIDTEKAMSFLDEQITQYEQVLREAEERLKNFKLANLDRLGSSQDSVGSMLALDADIEKVRTELRAAEQRRDALRKQLASEDPVFLSDSTGGPAASAPGMDPLAEIDSRADALRRNLDELLRRYTEEHPDVVGTRRILAELERQRESVLEDQRRAGPASRSKGTTRREPNLVYQQLKVALADAEANVAALGGRLSELEARYSRIRAAARLRPEFEAELAQLNRDYQIQKTNFEQLVQRREQAKMTGNLDQSGSVAFRVIDPPRVSSQPVAPNRPRLLLAVMFLSVAAGVGASLAVSQLFPVVSTTKDLRLVSQMSVLGSVSLRPSPAQILHRKRKNYAFGGGVAGLVAVFGFAVTAIVAAVVR
jgi:polysaccharide chain length determinant protein (PEP-CTERM system associated)